MTVTGIICEYNPMHLGHKKQIDTIRSTLGQDTGIVCLMSGNYVQRGTPAIIDKSLRAEAAILSGADLVLELPVNYALSSAEGFAAGGVRILSSFCDYLSFGCETGDQRLLLDIAKALLSDSFPPILKEELEKGWSFPAARQAALSRMGIDSAVLSQPNNILAVEYCKAMISENSNMMPLPILREGSYHASTADPENPSATAIRELMATSRNWTSFVPESAVSLFESAALHTLSAGERAILAKLRTMTDAQFEALPYGSEGLWRKLMHASRKETTLESIASAVKSKRYTRTRIDRMILCAFLGLTKQMMETPSPYTRVLAFNDKGRSILKEAKNHAAFLNTGESVSHQYWELEQRCGNLYGLFAMNELEPPNAEEGRRIVYHKESTDP